MFIILFISFHLSFLYAKDNTTHEDHFHRPNKNAQTQTYPKNIQVTLTEENRPPQKKLSRLVNKNTLLNLNIDFYFLNVLAYLDVLKWFTKNGHH